MRGTCKFALLGNHDQAALFDPSNFNERAERAIRWTRAQLETPVPNRDAMEERWEFLASMPKTQREDDHLFVHGSPRNPVNEYVFPRTSTTNGRWRLSSDWLIATVFRDTPMSRESSPNPAPSSAPRRSISSTGSTGEGSCNVGSVGQPRDGDWRACYVLLDSDAIHYRRVEYDVETTVKKIQKVNELDNFLAERLRQGR